MSYIASIGHQADDQAEIDKVVRKTYGAKTPVFRPSQAQVIIKVEDLTTSKTSFSMLNASLAEKGIHFTYARLDLSEGDDLYVYLDKAGMAGFKSFVDAF